MFLQVKELGESGRLMFGTVDTWILWNLTGATQVNQGIILIRDRGVTQTDLQRYSVTETEASQKQI